MLTKKEIEKFEMDAAVRFCFDYILPISDNRVLATHGDEISLITKDGEMICTYDSIQVPTYNSSSDFESMDDSVAMKAKPVEVDDYLIIIQDGLYGLIDYDGEIILDPKYSVLRFVGESRLECFIE